jgi:hypothetical protein
MKRLMLSDAERRTLRDMEIFPSSSAAFGAKHCVARQRGHSFPSRYNPIRKARLLN